MMKDETKIRDSIFQQVKALYSLRESQRKFSPGETPISYAGRVYDEREMVNLVDASLDFWLTAGRYAEDFEKKFAKFLGLRFCALVNSGSSANLVALSALTSPLLGARRLKPGDEVITTACGFPTTLNPILQNNLIPVFVDIEPGTYNIDPRLLKKAVSRKTRAIFVAHTLGNPINLDAVLDVVKKNDLWLVEDNCDALGSQYRGRYTGTFGHLATSSFYPPHHMTMGEGGAVLTNDPLLNRIVLSLRDWGRDCWCPPGKDNTCGCRFTKQFGQLPMGYDHKYVYSHIGYNLKVTDMQAAVGVAQLEKLPKFIQARRKNFARFLDYFRQHEEFFVLPKATVHSEPSWFGFPLLVKKSAPFSRADIVHWLEDHKVATRMLFGGNLTKQPAYEGVRCRIPGGLRHTDDVMNQLFWIGVYPGIGPAQYRYVTGILTEFLRRRS